MAVVVEPIPASKEEEIRLRLALEGIECVSPSVFANLIEIIHPVHGSTFFDSWQTLIMHCDENWARTYWPER